MLAFSRDVFFSNYAAYSAAAWPVHILAALLILIVLAALWRPIPAGGRIVSAILAVFWLWTGIAYHWFAFTTIFFVAPVLAVLFILQALLLLWAGVVRDRLVIGRPGDARLLTGVLLLALALFGYPLGDSLAGVELQALRLAGMAPGASVLFTLAALALAGPVWPRYLAVIPVLWLIYSLVIAWMLGAPVDAGLSGAGLVAAFVLIFGKRQRAPDTK